MMRRHIFETGRSVSSITVLLVMMLSLASCVSSDSMTSALLDTTPSVNPNSGNNRGNFPGCVSGQAESNTSIRINFSVPAGATKMTIYRDGKLAYSTNSASATYFVDSDNSIVEGQTYHYSCEAIINQKALLGTVELDVATVSVSTPNFRGIDDVQIIDAHSAKVSWLPPIPSTVATAYYEVYYSVGNTVKNPALGAPAAGSPKIYKFKVSSAVFEKTLTGLGDELPYAFGVHACSSADKCDRNAIVKTATTPNDEYMPPATQGATLATMVNGQASITAPWDDSNGAVYKRYVYQCIGNGVAGDSNCVRNGAPNTSGYTVARIVDVPNPLAPLNPILLPDPKDAAYFLQNKNYYFMVVDLDSNFYNNYVVVNHVAPITIDGTSRLYAAVNTGKTLPPNFPGGITDLVLGTPKDTSLIAYWTAIASDTVDPDNGASHYQIYMTSAAPGSTPSDPCAEPKPIKEISASSFTAGQTASFDINNTSVGPNTVKERMTYRVCVKARDSVGNVSANTQTKMKTTFDVTPPAFDGAASATFANNKLTVRWNPSQASDLDSYKVMLWKTSDPTVVTISRPASALANLTSTDITPSEFAVTDYDELHIEVEACDNAFTATNGPFNTANVCSTTTPIILNILDTTPPPGFLGIDPSAGKVKNLAEGSVQVAWLVTTPASGKWYDYRGFRVYTYDGNAQTYNLVKDCPCANSVGTGKDQYCGDKPTTCDVSGLDPHKPYTFHVSAYDSVTPTANETVMPHPNVLTGVTLTTMDTTPPNFSWSTKPVFVRDASNLPVGMRLNWTAGTDNQRGTGDKIHYEIYRKVGSTFNSCPSTGPSVPAPADGTKVPFPGGFDDTFSGSSLTYTDSKDNWDASVQGQNVYYAVYARDESGNRRCGGVMYEKVPDWTAPVITNVTTNPSGPSVGPVKWTLYWTMNDNSTPSDSLYITVKLKKAAAADDFPLEGSDATAETLSLPGPQGKDFTNAVTDHSLHKYGIIDQQGVDGTDQYYNYRIIIADGDGNTSSATKSIRSDRKGPDPVAANLAWNESSPTKAASINPKWSKSTDPSLTTHTVQFYSGADCNEDNKLGSLSGTPSGSDPQTVSYANPPEAVFSYKVISYDQFSNSSVSACSPPLTVDRSAPAVDHVTSSVGAGTYRSGAVIPIQVVFNESVRVTKGADWPKIALETGGTNRFAVYDPDTSTGATLVFKYTVDTDDQSANLNYKATNSLAANLNGSVISDIAGNVLTAPNLPDPSTPQSLAGDGSVIRRISAKGPSSPGILIISALTTYTNSNTPNIVVSAGSTATQVWLQNTPVTDSDPVTVNAPASYCSGEGTWSPFAPDVVDGTSMNYEGWDIGLSQYNSQKLRGVPARVCAKFADVDGNESGCVCDTIIHDNIPPSVAFTSPASDSYVGTTINLAGTCEIGIKVRLYGDITPTPQELDCTDNGSGGGVFSQTFTVSAGDGSKTIVAEQTDQATNAGQASLTVTKDTTPPAIAITSPANNSYINTVAGPTQNSATFAISGSCDEAGRPVVIKVDSALNGTGGTCNGTTWTATIDTTGLSDNNDHTVYASISDAVGNISNPPAQVTLKKDVTPPTISISSGPSNGTINGTGSTDYTLTFSGATATSFDASKVTLTTTGGASCSSKAVSNVTTSGATVTLSSCTGNGTVKISIAAGSVSDAAGNVNVAAGPGNPVTIDTTAPLITITTPANNGYINSSTPASMTVSGTCEAAENNRDVTIYVDGSSAGTVKCTSLAWTGSITQTSLSQGSHTIAARVTDLAGNDGNASITVTKDTVGPTVSIGSPSPASGTYSTSFSWTVSFTDASTISLGSSDIVINGAGLACGSIAITGTGLTSRTITLSQCSGTGSLGFKFGNAAQDDAGNWNAASGDSATVSLNNTVDAAKSTVIATPASVAAGSGTSTITVILRNSSSQTLEAQNVTPSVVSKDGSVTTVTLNPSTATATNSSGQMTFTARTGGATERGLVTLQAVGGGVTLNNKPPVMFLSATPVMEYRASLADGMVPGASQANTAKWYNLYDLFNGALYNTPAWSGSGTAGSSPYIVSFNNASSQYANLGTAMNAQTSFTIEAWFRPQATGTDSVILSNGTGGLKLSQVSGKLRFQVGSSGTCDSANTLVNNAWYFVSAMYNAGSLKMIVSDTANDFCTASGGSYSTSGDLDLGANSPAASYWKGDVAEIRGYGSDQTANYTTHLGKTVGRIETTTVVAPTASAASAVNRTINVSYGFGASNNAYKIDVFRAENSGMSTALTQVGTYKTASGSIADTNLDVSKTYYYQAKAWNIAGGSNTSAVTSATPGAECYGANGSYYVRYYKPDHTTAATLYDGMFNGVVVNAANIGDATKAYSQNGSATDDTGSAFTYDCNCTCGVCQSCTDYHYSVYQICKNR